MTSFKRHIQHHLIKLKSLVKAQGYHSPQLNERLLEVEVSNPDCFETALFNFTVDFELIWGNGREGDRDHSVQRRVEYADKQAQAFPAFIKLLEETRFSASWAVLGKLANYDILPSEDEAFNPAWSKNWYDGQYKNLETNLWDGTSYLENIKKCVAPQEILSHGHAHIDYGDDSVTESVARWDMETSLFELKDSDCDVKGFVYPCNRHNYQHLLVENNIKIIRGQNKNWSITDDLIQTPLGFWISPAIYSYKDIFALIDRAVEKRSFVHPWMHMVECDLKQDDIENFYRPIFEYVLELESKGKIKNISFDEIRQTLRKTE